jgi:hypothetical protein
MNYIDQAAAAIRRHVNPTLLPKADAAELFRGYAALMYSKEGDISAEDVHNVWAAWAAATDPHNKSLRPFDELSSKVKHEDEPYVQAIKATWTELNEAP